MCMAFSAKLTNQPIAENCYFWGQAMQRETKIERTLTSKAERERATNYESYVAPKPPYGPY